MKIRFLILTAIVYITSLSSVFSTNGYQINNGVLDLKLIDISETKSIKLQGDWEFYWNKLLEPKDFENNELKPDLYGKVPKSWSSYQIDSIKLPIKGFATYRMVIHKKADTATTIYGLKVYTVFSNYKLWVNGKLLSEVGVVGKTKEEAKPEFKFKDIPIVLNPDIENTENIEIIFQVSNYFHRRSGLQRPIFFSTFNNISSETRWMDILNLIIVGIILVIGVNHLNMYLFRRKDVSNLYFSIVCLVMILRNLSTADRIITYIFPNIGWELIFKLDNFSGFGTIPLFALFIYSLFKVDFPKIIKDIILYIGIIITILVFATPANFYGKFRMAFEIYILIFGLYLQNGFPILVVRLLLFLKKR